LRSDRFEYSMYGRSSIGTMKLIDEFIMSSTWKKDTEEQRDLASWRLVLAEDSLSGPWTLKE
jgi:hypothetical protein